MHELAVCQALMRQVETIARRENADGISRVLIHLGPLSGVVPEILEQAFKVARVGTLADGAELAMVRQPVRVRCLRCGTESEVEMNRLVCISCGDNRTQLIGGDELLLTQVELKRTRSSDQCPIHTTNGDS